VNQSPQPLVVGAGPVGKAAALFLAREGIPTRIIDSVAQPSEHSKALAVNPRTLEILESTGITEKMLKIGHRIRAVPFRFADKPPTLPSLQQLKHKYPFMLALSQATTERLLNEALEAAAGKVERGISLVTCRNAACGVERVLLIPTGLDSPLKFT
jgi:2-polyprenyl-6-methoxyphenol hydroxylase-like FAD-dependent oxidoreductase